MNVTMMLCDAVQIADGKLYILGGGWSMTGPDPIASGVAIKFDVDWNEAESAHRWGLFLEDADGKLAVIETPAGEQTIEVHGEFTVPHPPGVPVGSPVDMPVAVNVGALPLKPGSRYVWRLYVDGEPLPGSSLAFTTRPRPDASLDD